MLNLIHPLPYLLAIINNQINNHISMIDKWLAKLPILYL
jgi:hypothetical protein